MTTPETTPTAEPSDIFKELFATDNNTYYEQRQREAKAHQEKWSTPAKIAELYDLATPDIDRWHPWMMTRFHEDGCPVVPGWLNRAPSSCDNCGKCCSTPMPGRPYKIPVNLEKDPQVKKYAEPKKSYDTAGIRETRLPEHVRMTHMKMCGDSCAQLDKKTKRCGIYAIRPEVCRVYPRGAQQCRAFCGDMAATWSKVAQLDHHFWAEVDIKHLPAMLKHYPNIAFGDTEARNEFSRTETELLMAVTRASYENQLKDHFVAIGDAMYIVNEMPLYAFRVPGMTLNKYREIFSRIEKAEPKEETINIDAECFV